VVHSPGDRQAYCTAGRSQRGQFGRGAIGICPGLSEFPQKARCHLRGKCPGGKCHSPPAWQMLKGKGVVHSPGDRATGVLLFFHHPLTLTVTHGVRARAASAAGRCLDRRLGGVRDCGVLGGDGLLHQRDARRGRGQHAAEQERPAGEAKARFTSKCCVASPRQSNSHHWSHIR
jgi:hypothetical protein